MKLIARLPTEKFSRLVDKFRSAKRTIQSRLKQKRRTNGIASVGKTEFQQILEECLEKLSKGTSTVEECLARYPQHASDLRPLLRTVYFLNFRRDEKPVLAYKAPSRAYRPQGLTLLWRTSVVFAVLAVAVLVTGTASAQSALPGDTFYGWKRASEEVWRAFSADRVATEIAISNRRITEMLAVAHDPARSDSALEGYLEALERLKLVEDEQTLTRIVPVLQTQRNVLRDAGIVATELDDHLVRDLRVLPPAAAVLDTPTDVPLPIEPPASQPDPTEPQPSEPQPSEPEPAEPEPTDVPTEPEPTLVPTEPEPTSVPTEPPPGPTTEPEPTAVPTEPEPTSVPTEPPLGPTTEPESTAVPPDPGLTPVTNNLAGDVPIVVGTPQP